MRSAVFPTPGTFVLERKDVGEVKRTMDDGRLPMEDDNTRLIVIAEILSNPVCGRRLSREAFHNVAYFCASSSADRAEHEHLPHSVPTTFRNAPWWS